MKRLECYKVTMLTCNQNIVDNNFKADIDKTFINMDSKEDIGQMVYQIPTVFSYYLSTYAPPGRVAR